MSMDPVKRLISIAGLCLFFILMFSIFYGFFTDVVVDQQFPKIEPNHQILLVTPIETASIASTQSTGTLFFMKYQKGNVLYLENISMRVGMEITAYMSKDYTYRNGPLVGSLLGSRGNVTLYVPSDIDFTKYNYVVFWSSKNNQVFAYANLTNISY